MSVFRRLLAGRSLQVTPVQAKELQSSGAILLDVRQGHEWKAGHAPKALHVPLPLLQSSLGRISRDSTILTAVAPATSSECTALLDRSSPKLSAFGSATASWPGIQTAHW